MENEGRARPETPPVGRPATATTANAGAAAASCHPDLACPVCSARGKLVRMQPVKAHYQCPQCRYFDSCCM